MCFQAIAEMTGSIVGIFILITIGVVVLFLAGIIIFDLLMIFIGLISWLVINPIPLALIIIIVLFFILKR